MRQVRVYKLAAVGQQAMLGLRWPWSQSEARTCGFSERAPSFLVVGLGSACAPPASNSPTMLIGSIGIEEHLCTSVSAHARRRAQVSVESNVQTPVNRANQCALANTTHACEARAAPSHRECRSSPITGRGVLRWLPIGYGAAGPAVRMW